MLILKPTIERNYWAGYIFLHDASSFVLYGTKKWKMKYKLHKKIYVLKMRSYFVTRDSEKWCLYITWEVCKSMKHGNGLSGAEKNDGEL